MGFRKRLTALLLVLVMLLPLSGCGLGGNIDSFLRSGGTDFSEMEYVRPDLADIRSCVKEIYGLLEGGGSYEQVTNALDEFYSLYWSFYTMQTLAGIRSDIDTSDEYYAEEYEFCCNTEVELSNTFDELMTACADSALAEKLDEEYFLGMLAERYSADYTENLEEIFKLYEEENRLLGEYRAAMVEFYAEDEPDAAYGEYNPEVCGIYIELVKLRNAMAQLMGYDSYEELAYADYGREYTPDDLREYFAAVREYILPLYKKALEDGAIDRAYENVYSIEPEEALAIVRKTVRGMDRVFSRSMGFMLGSGLYDISASRHKYDDSYVTYIDDYNSPFLFVNPLGFEDDILTIAHEFGHFTDSFLNFDTNANLDTSETLSQGMEYLLLCYLKDDELRRDLTAYKLADVLHLYINQSCFNEFERRVFNLPEAELTVENVNGIYAELAREYGFSEDYEADIGTTWIDITHFFDYPFYVASYCVSDSAAFSIFTMEQEKQGSGLEAYLEVLGDAPNMGFLELLEAKGIDSPITAQSVKNIAEALSEVLGL